MNAPQVPPVPPRNAASPAMKIVLAVSLALNLGVAGVIGGAMLRGGGDDGHGGMVRDLGFGVFTEALSVQDKLLLRDRFLERTPGFRQERHAMRADLDAILVALRADPFDAAQLDAVLGAQNTRLSSRLDVGQSLIRDFLVDLTPAARQAFADRLEARLMRGGKP